ncbi:MAG: alpha/beta hydrolase family esterase, partial [Acidimicrobiales bacterium]
ASSGCERPAEPGPSSLTLVHDGMERAYDLFSPPAPLHEGPLPLVLDFHGATATAGNEAAVTGFTDLAAQEGFFVVNPQGSGLLSYWNIESTSSTRLADDVGFVVALLDEIGAARCVDLTRIHATGLSNGGMFSSTLACALADRIASFAPVAGTHVPPDCGSPPVPLLITHGTDDPIVPYDGSGLLGDILGSGVLGLLTGDLGPMFSVTTTPIPEWVATWADHNGCDPTPSSARIEPDVEVRTYGGCDGRGALVFQVVEDGGHVWPGSTAHVDSEAIAGRTSMTIDATRRAWDFFASHPLPADLVGATP